MSTPLIQNNKSLGQLVAENPLRARDIVQARHTDTQRALLIIQNKQLPGNAEENTPTLDEDIIQTWKTDPKIRGEFRDLTVYAAFRRAEASGRFRVLGAGRGLTRERSR